MSNAFEIKIPSDPKFAKIIRCGIQHSAQVVGFTDSECQAITLAVDEAVTNIIRHAYQGDATQVITAICHLQDDGLEIILKDNGTSADASQMQSRPLDQVRPGGLGVHFMKTIMDTVDYKSSPENGNQLTMRKNLSGKGKPDAEN